MGISDYCRPLTHVDGKPLSPAEQAAVREAGGPRFFFTKKAADEFVTRVLIRYHANRILTGAKP